MNKKKCGLVAILGLPNAGKSSLLNALIGQKIAPVSMKPQTTRRSVQGIFTTGDAQLVFVDTPGLLKAKQSLQEYMQKQALSVLGKVDVVIWVSDAPHLISKSAKLATDKEQLAYLFKRLDGKKPVIWALNKVDLLPNKSLLLPLTTEVLNEFPFTEVIPVSVTQGDGLAILIKEVVKLLPEQEFMFAPDMLTDAFERNLVAELIREKALTQLDNEIPHQLAVTIDTFDEARREDKKKPIVEISAIIHVERDSQKKIVIGKGGSKIKIIGTKARAEIELLLQCQVMLNLKVRVEPDW
ncbi:MAG: GTPase Era, partial [bacterium]|nr:GTPase Era [bacterium]